MVLKKTLSILLSAAMLTACAVSTVGSASAAETQTETTEAAVTTETSSTDYGLADNIQDGVILHCFDWTYSQIEEELANIAAAGFTAVQTSPAQEPSDPGAWYWLYQPLGFYIADTGNSNYPLGTKAQLVSLCSAAEEYGIKVIVDVVANHLAGSHTNIQDDLKDGQYWHNYGSSIDYSNRYAVTHGDIGMQDLATENSYVQTCVYNYIQELKACGVDGIRFDAAKHISLPSEADDYSSFWSTVTSDDDLYYYGEILVGPDDTGRTSTNIALMKEYAKYMSYTDSSYSSTVLWSVNDGSITGDYANWAAEDTGISSSNIVYWAESHDTYSNESSETTKVSVNTIDRAYALVASRNEATALYFSRPYATSNSDIQAGVKGSTHFTDSAVAEVNKFHNAMIGKLDYYSSSGSVASVTREDGGAVIVTASSSGGTVTATNGGGFVPSGTYTDRISGNTFTVTDDTISGTVGSTGIAVIYDDSMVSTTTSASVSASPSSSTFTTSTLDVTLSVSNADSGTYTTSEGASGTYSNGDVITIGANTSVSGGSASITVKLSATGEDGETVSKTYTYTKKDSSAATIIYFDNSSYNWSAVYAYVYFNDGEIENASWPGELMTYDSSLGLYYLEIDDDLADGYVIFTESSSATTNRYPADQEAGLSIGGTSMLFSANYSWTEYTASTSSDTNTSTNTSTDSDTGTSTDTSTDSDTGTSTDSDSDTGDTYQITVLLGDADLNGSVNLIDAAVAQRAIAALTTLNETAAAAADVDGNSTVNTADVLYIQKYDVGLTSSYSIGSNVTVWVSVS